MHHQRSVFYEANYKIKMANTENGNYVYFVEIVRNF